MLLRFFILYDDIPVLRNILGIKDNKVLDLVEAKQSRANMISRDRLQMPDINPDLSSYPEKILLDAVCEKPVSYDIASLAPEKQPQRQEVYQKYRYENYKPEPPLQTRKRLKGREQGLSAFFVPIYTLQSTASRRM